MRTTCSWLGLEAPAGKRRSAAFSTRRVETLYRLGESGYGGWGFQPQQDSPDSSTACAELYARRYNAGMSDGTRTESAQRLLTPLRHVRGIGWSRAELLARLRLQRVQDVLFFFPRDYEQLPAPAAVKSLEAKTPGTVIGEIDELELRELGGGKSVLGILLRCEDGYVRLVWFNQPYMSSKFQRGQRVIASGIPRLTGISWQMSHPSVSPWPEGTPLPTGGILPIYPLTEGLTQPVMRRLVQGLVDGYATDVEEVLSEEFRAEHGLLSITDALRSIHQPPHSEGLAAARRRFIYQELFVLQLALALRRRHLTLDRQAPELPESPKIRARILRLFPFELTADQLQAIDEVAADMARPFPMNRLLQGDVGTGKTVVAMYAMLLAVAHGRQAALMAPTEVLARQHARVLARNLQHGRVRIALLTGTLTRSERARTLAAIQRGEVDIVVGTHALANAVVNSPRPLAESPVPPSAPREAQASAAESPSDDAATGTVTPDPAEPAEPVDAPGREGLDPEEAEIREAFTFARLGLVVIDEQHKFGVEQRARMKQAGLHPHYLVMTATPIPRTVSMTLFGDLDASILRAPPPGRQAVHTYQGTDESRERWWEFFRKKLREGRQGYVVLPWVDDAEGLEAGVEQAFEALANGALEEFRLGLVHGRMSGHEKDDAMQRFASGETQVLIATSVVEVGVDVPNATLMTIEGGERFGLAQLHQLRGRISRGTFPGFLCVFAQDPSAEAQARLDAFVRTTDGFELAELDFQLRGPGDLFGTRQHGLPPLRIADVFRDAAVLEEARRDAQAVVAADPNLSAPVWEILKRRVLARYGRALEFGDVG